MWFLCAGIKTPSQNTQHQLVKHQTLGLIKCQLPLGLITLQNTQQTEARTKVNRALP
ncbi:MAG: hypothetical protein ACJARW_001314 [Methylophilaceae bacterium]|jgi:hypothetical protein